MPNIAEHYRLLRESAAILHPEPVTTYLLQGVDVLEWLQGQATNDVLSLALGDSISFCLCKPTGQIEAICRAWLPPDQDGVYVESPSACAAALAERVETMVILEDVRAAEVPGGAPEPITAAGAMAVAALRIEVGLPVWGWDIGPKTLPPEMGAAFEAKHVSYTKGCYVGQEVLMRLHSRGHPNWVWMGMIAEAPLETGASVSTPDRDDAGRVTSTALSPRLGPIGAARVRRETAVHGQAVVVRHPWGEVSANLRSFPML